MSRGTAPLSRRRPRKAGRGGPETRRRILAAALRLFSRNGFHGASIRDIAGAVGLTEAAIYHYFSSKKAIVEALYDERGFMSAMEELESLPGRLPLDEQLVANAVASAHLWDRNADLLKVVITEMLRGNKTARIVHHGLMDRWRKGILDLLAHYQVRGEIDGVVGVEEAADTWVNLMFGLFVDRLLALAGLPSRGRFLTPEVHRQVEARAKRFARWLQAGP